MEQSKIFGQFSDKKLSALVKHNSEDIPTVLAVLALVKHNSEDIPTVLAVLAALEVNGKVRYLGVQIGPMNTPQAYVAAMAKMKACAVFLKVLPLELHDKIEISEYGFSWWCHSQRRFSQRSTPFTKWHSGLRLGFSVQRWWQTHRKQEG